MEKNVKSSRRRVRVLIGFSLVILVIFLAVLFTTQVSHGSEYRAKSIASNATWQTVDASRGILTDRNGKVLVSNRLTYTLTLDKTEFSDDAGLNAEILRLVSLARDTGTVWSDTIKHGGATRPALPYSNLLPGATGLHQHPLARDNSTC